MIRKGREHLATHIERRTSWTAAEGEWWKTNCGLVSNHNYTEVDENGRLKPYPPKEVWATWANTVNPDDATCKRCLKIQAIKEAESAPNFFRSEENLIERARLRRITVWSKADRDSARYMGFDSLEDHYGPFGAFKAWEDYDRSIYRSEEEARAAGAYRE